MHWIVAPGFFSSGPVIHALEVGSVVAVVSAVVGVFVVLRGQSFAGHALSDVATAGGAGAALGGFSTLIGFLAGGVAGASAIEAIGVHRVRSRDMATGIVLGSATGLSALFLYLTSNTGTSSAVTQEVLFGSIFTVTNSVFPAAAVLGGASLLILAVTVRPLLLSSMSNELAVARGVNVRLVGWLFMGSLAVAVGLASVVLGSILATALLIGPAAAAYRITQRVSTTVALAVVFALLSTWTGVLASYDSYNWSASHRALPVSFFVVLLIVFSYGGASLWQRSRLSKRAHESTRVQ